ncbi:DUF3800 domain-containing protein [Sorangium sp. So ce185]|uniref:DUF3800 domain-containing protein n=1 Tax=Sorangium sp. So ce185 TaxID=3133287 RepID=UPI003F648A6E
MTEGPLRTIEEWLQLPELELSYDVAEYEVLKVGMLWGVAPDARPEDAEPRCDLVGDRPTTQIDIWGTITIETPDGAQLLRLPDVLAEWAFDTIQLRRKGMKVFPRRVRFRTTQEGIEVTPINDAPLRPNKTEPPVAPAQENDQPPASTGRDEPEANQVKVPDVLTVYVDESGNTGDAAAGSANSFGQQRVFTLVGVADDLCTGSIGTILANLRRKHGVQATEIKNRTMERYPAFVSDLVRRLCMSNAIFVEITDKKFYLATNIVTFVLRGPKLDPLVAPELANELAETMTDIIDDAVLLAYGEFAKTADRESFERFENEFRRSTLRAQLMMGPHQEREFRLLKRIEEAFDAALGERGGASNYPNFLPPPDRGRTGRKIPMLPHVPSFADLLGRINRHARSRPSVRIVHDHQEQFSVALRECLSFLDRHALSISDMATGTIIEAHADWNLAPGKFQLTFANSKTEPGIQAADVIARLCTQRMNAVLAHGSPATAFDVAVDALHDHGRSDRGTGVNILATTKDAENFWAVQQSLPA